MTARGAPRQKRSETPRRQGEDFRLLAEAMPQIVWITRPDGWNVYVNQQWMDYTGLTFEETLGDGWSKPFHPEDRQRARNAWRHATATIGAYALECRLRRADGVYRWWLIRGVPVRDASGSILKWFGTCTDIDDLKRAQLEASESEERFAKVFNSSLVAIGIGEMSGRLIDVNERCAEFFGYAREEMIGRTIYELRLWADLADRERIVSAISAGRSISSGEAGFRRKSGEIRHALVSLEAMTLAGEAEPLLMLVLVDLTERRRLESELLQAQKMEAVGRLAGGVAHDFNNILGVIMGYGEIVQRRIPAADPLHAKVAEILKAAERGAALTRQLLAFSRKQVLQPRVLDLNLVVADMDAMLRRLIGENIELEMSLREPLGSVRADPGQIEQVLMNLVVNARDAMPTAGSLLIETAEVDLDVTALALHPGARPGAYVLLAVSDTGHGMDRETVSRIFEPFFTTKSVGAGTGLGLSTVYGIVEQSGGHVEVYSEKGRGTTFKVYLPRIEATATRATHVATPPPPRAGSETILLVEDEAALRAVIGETLAGGGYRVLEAATPGQALDFAGAHEGPIHAVLTDVVMPEMSGRDLARLLKPLRPEAPVVYMSGYTDDAIGHHGLLDAGTLFLQKPFTADALLWKLHEALAPV